MEVNRNSRRCQWWRSRFRELNFAQPPLEKSALAVIGGQGERSCIALRCLHRGSDAAQEKIVEADDLRPVRIFGTRRLTMQCRDRRLKRERTGPAAKRLLNEWQRLGDLLLIPAAPILLFEKDQI